MTSLMWEPALQQLFYIQAKGNRSNTDNMYMDLSNSQQLYIHVNYCQD